MEPSKKSKSSKLKRLAIGIVGSIVLLAGIITIPYPGPGWLIVFAGLGILATEFEWAQAVLDRLKRKYDAWQNWLKAQPAPIKAVFWLTTFCIVVATIWLLNGYGILSDLLHLDIEWARSPLV